MGWTGLYREKGQNNKDFFQRELFGQGSCRIVECATVNGVFYAACEQVAGPLVGEVWGLVVLLKYDNKSGDFCNFWYKEMSEDMGPFYYDCPARVLDALTPARHERAIAWRAQCRERLNRPKVKKGVIIEFDNPVHFSDGTVHQRFYCQSLRPAIFEALDGTLSGCLYRIHKRTYELAKVVG